MGALAPPFAGVGASASCAISCSRLYEESACEFSFSAAITGGRLFMCGGSGGIGVMGDGKCCSRSVPTQALGALADKTVNAVACGEGHVLALAEGRCYSWGSIGYCEELNESETTLTNIGDGRLGLGKLAGLPTFAVLHECVNLPTEVPLPGKRVAKIAAGRSHSVLLSEDGLVYTCGTVGANVSRVPQQVNGELSGKRVTDVSCGEEFTAALTVQGKVYVWGAKARSVGNNPGCPGVAAEEPTDSPREVGGALSDKPVLALACGRSHCLAVTNEGLFGWGSGPALGLEGDVLEPTAVGSASALAQKKVVDISCSASISLARTDDGCLFHWGEFWDPDVEDFECIKNPTEIPGLRAVGMSCGDAHYLAVRLLPNDLCLAAC